MPAMETKEEDQRDVAQLVRELVGALKALRELQVRACSEDTSPADAEDLRQQFETTLLDIQRLQSELLQVEVSPELNAQIRDALAEAP